LIRGLSWACAPVKFIAAFDRLAKASSACHAEAKSIYQRPAPDSAPPSKLVQTVKTDGHRYFDDRLDWSGGMTPRMTFAECRSWAVAAPKVLILLAGFCLVEPRGFEPLTSAVRLRRSPN
jgi:hypothetical protein